MSKTSIVETSPTPGSKTSHESIHEEAPAAPVIIPGVATSIVETSPTPRSKTSHESVHEEAPTAPVIIPGVTPQVIEIPKLPCEILTPCDSQYPSYTNFVLPYRVICRQRYQRCARKYRRQFLKEIRRQEIMQFRALDGIRIRREFCDPMMAPLPSEDRIKLTAKELYKLDLIINA